MDSVSFMQAAKFVQNTAFGTVISDIIAESCNYYISYFGKKCGDLIKL